VSAGAVDGARADPDAVLAAGFRAPCWAVIFSSVRSRADAEGYGAAAGRMVELAASMPGYLGVESVRGADGFGITVSYWETEEAIRGWQRHAEHLEAQRGGRERWYEAFELRVCRVERARSFRTERAASGTVPAPS
jgi:heme-degrading monooxygenase HmoA